MYIIKN